MNTGCIVQARMTSSRLPGKVLRTLDYKTGASVLDSVIERLKATTSVDCIIIATTTNAEDEALVEYAQNQGVGCYRGSESDVLERFYGAATEFELDNVIRITSDCPFLDPAIIDQLVQLFVSGDYQYASNCIRRTYPHGLDCEILTYRVLKWLYENTTDSFYREHVTSYVTSHLDEFEIGSLSLADEDYSNVRVTVDTINDYTLACLVSDLIKDEPDRFSFRTILKCFEEHPYISNINGDIMQKKRYESIEDECAAAVKLLKLQEMHRAAAILEGRIE